jgi:hypothetical protein
MDYENSIYSIVPSQEFHLLGTFKYEHSEKLKISTLFYGQP